MKSLFVIVLLCCCIELSYQRYLLRNEENDGQQHVIVKRDFGDDFFDKIIEKGKSLFVDDDENKEVEEKQHSEVTPSNDSNDKFDNDRRDDNTNSDNNNNNNNDHGTNDHNSKVAVKPDKSDDDFISEETLKKILAKVVAYAASSDNDNQEQSDSTNSDTVKHDGSETDSDALMDKLGNILIKEGIKIGVAELASSFLGKK